MAKEFGSLGLGGVQSIVMVLQNATAEKRFGDYI